MAAPLHPSFGQKSLVLIKPSESKPAQSREKGEPTEALTLLRICDDIQSVPIRCKDWKHLQHLRIPEEQGEKLPIHVLIGVDSYGQFWVKKFYEIVI
ncbi:hypothetical protein T07_13609 [Trichinella nelsoni]|uniref:Uncharacterized protein n=1 Tax=Trichinella nelsoni TaxID=6336 RepID=A0A0V0S3X9_9BILA|nr:hypothetical protein T07_13609 [Trichinella nelsoni]